jgi:hypothetical protein
VAKAAETGMEAAPHLAQEEEEKGSAGAGEMVTTVDSARCQH